MKNSFFFVALGFFLFTASLSAQFEFESKDKPADAAGGGPRLGPGVKQTWRAGVEIPPSGAQMEDTCLTLPVPMDWPEQKILRVNEVKLDPSLSGKIRYKTVNNGAREMILELGNFRGHRKVEIVVEFDMENFELLPPEKTDGYVIPKRITSELSPFLKESPKIECSKNKSKFLDIFNKQTRDKKTDWEKVEALYTFVQQNVKYDELAKTKEAKGALAVISMPEGTWTGDCKDMSCLFVALCRVGGIPARLVRVPEHCYAEFYLEEPAETGAKVKAPKGYWFPCQVAGTYSFGGIPERQPILQKGDSYPDPENPPRGKKIFMTECFEGNLAPGSPQPGRPKWIHEVKQ